MSRGSSKPVSLPPPHLPGHHLRLPLLEHPPHLHPLRPLQQDRFRFHHPTRATHASHRRSRRTAAWCRGVHPPVASPPPPQQQDTRPWGRDRECPATNATLRAASSQNCRSRSRCSHEELSSATSQACAHARTDHVVHSPRRCTSTTDREARRYHRLRIDDVAAPQCQKVDAMGCTQSRRYCTRG